MSFFSHHAGKLIGLAAVLAGSVAIFSSALAVNANYEFEYKSKGYVVDYVADFSGLNNFLSKCSNNVCDSQSGDSSLGWCQCTLKLKPFSEEYRWNFFNSHTQEEIFSIFAKYAAPNAPAKAPSYLRFDSGPGRSCQITVQEGIDGNQAAARLLVEKNQCRFERAFCCCKTDPNGQKSGCYRSVNYNVEARKAQCAEGETPSSETDAGCLDQNATASKKAGQPDTNVDVSEALGELQQRAAGLNQLEGISQPTAQATLQVWIGRFIGFFFIGFVGMFALVFYVYAGVLWLTAAGNAERIERAKKTLLWTTLGIMATLASYLVISQVFTFIATGAFSR